MRPIIGISSDFNEKELSLSLDYLKAVESAGGLPLVFPILKESKLIQELSQKIDGLLISGGDDILPSFYREKEIKKFKYVHPLRINFEKILIKNFFRQKKPILGICYGIQLLNVIFGGILYQDIPLEIKNLRAHKKTKKEKNDKKHKIFLSPGSLLFKIFQKENLIVNSIHHQAIKKIAPKFIISAKSSDHIIEAIEMPKYPFLLGVQWHPEKMRDELQSKLFASFVKSCCIYPDYSYQREILTLCRHLVRA